MSSMLRAGVKLHGKCVWALVGRAFCARSKGWRGLRASEAGAAASAPRGDPPPTAIARCANGGLEANEPEGIQVPIR